MITAKYRDSDTAASDVEITNEVCRRKLVRMLLRNVRMR
jgi:hypothetical protein